MSWDCVIVGGGIVGLATALALSQRYPEARLLVLEKERELACHQTGRNSGVIHSGIYYRPGSFKALFSRTGSRSMVEFCAEHGIAHHVCGKLIIATRASELPRLEALYQRGLENGLAVSRLRPEEARELEPHVSCLAAVRVPSTGITDFKAVAAKMAALVLSAEHRSMRTGSRVVRIEPGRVVTEDETYATRFVVNCAGLHSDRMAGPDAPARIIPFRGEYYVLRPERARLVRGLIYPVPDPTLPFLGVHFTRMVDGSVHCGPNAVLSLKREGYHKLAFDLRDTLDTLAYPGFWKLAARFAAVGVQEMIRSLFKAAFVRSLQAMIPQVRSDDLLPCESGVRAQAVTPDGALVDDFLLVERPGAVHVCNAPSPAATCSLEIGKAVADRVRF